MLKDESKYTDTQKKVLINNPPPGKYMIRISAQNTLSKQGYSIAVLGMITNFTER